MDFYRKKQKTNWLKWIPVILIMVLVSFLLYRFLVPPDPKSLSVDGPARPNQNGPVSFIVNSDQPSPYNDSYGGFFVRIDNPGHTGSISDLLFTDQGKTLLSAALDGTVRVWNLAQKGKPVLVSTIRGILSKFESEDWSLELRRGMYGRVHAMVLSPDGTYLVTAAASRIRVYNLRQGCLSGIISGHSGEITDLALSADGNYLASASNDGTIVICDFALIRSYDEKGIPLKNFQFRTMKKLDEAASPVREICFSGTSLAAVAQDGSLRIYECGNFTPSECFRDPLRAVRCIAFSHSGKYLLAANADGGLMLSTRPDKTFRDFARLADTPQQICFSFDDRQVLIACGNEAGGGSLHRLSFPDGREIGELPVKKRFVGAIAATTREGTGWWASADNELHEIIVWDGNGEKYCSISSGALLVKNVQLSANGTIGLGILGSQDESRHYAPVTLCFDTKKLGLRPLSANDRLDGAISANDQLSVLPLGQTQSSLGILNGLVKLQINKDGEPQGDILSGPLNGFMHRCYTFAGKHLLVCGGRGGLLLVYDLKGNLVGQLGGCEGDILALAGSFTQPRVVVAAADHAVRIWDLQSLENEAKRGVPSDEYMIGFINGATTAMSKLGAYTKEVKLLQPEMSRLVLEDTAAWHAAGQYLRMFCLEYQQKIEPSLTLVLFPNREWLTWLPKGYVGLSSPAVMKYFGYQADYIDANRKENLKFLPFDRFYDSMFRPDLVMLAMNNHAKYMEFLHANKADGSFFESLSGNPPPEVDILAPTSGQRLPGRDLLVKVKIKDTGGGIGDVRLYHNGKLVSSRGVFRAFKSGIADNESSLHEEKQVIRGNEFYMEKGDKEKAFTVRLIPGKNTISCDAMNYRNTVMSAMKFRDVFSSMPERKPRLFCLVIGTNNFQNPDINLVFTHFDALGVAEMLRQNSSRYFSEVVVKNLLDPKKAKIQEALAELQSQMDPADTFVFYASSHGSLDGDRFCIVTADCDGSELNGGNSISSDELMEYTVKMPALQQVIILDTCFAGSASWTFNDLYETRMQTFSLGAGLHILSACSPYQYSAEGYNQHGVFSYYLIKALEGDADYFGNKDGQVSVLEVSKYIREQIKSSPIEFQSQAPMLSEYGKDVILVDRHK